MRQDTLWTKAEGHERQTTHAASPEPERLAWIFFGGSNCMERLVMWAPGGSAADLALWSAMRSINVSLVTQLPSPVTGRSSIDPRPSTALVPSMLFLWCLPDSSVCTAMHYCETIDTHKLTLAHVLMSSH